MKVLGRCVRSAAVGLWLLGPAVTDGQQTPPTPESHEEIVERILELRALLDGLLRALPPELRQEVERRWRERQSIEPVAPGTALDSPPAKAALEIGVPVVEAEAAVTEEEAVAEPPAPVTEAAPVAAVEPDIAEPARPECGTLAPFDGNQDGVVSAADRYWRYLRLGRDDESIDRAAALESLYELGIREIAVDLRFYKTADERMGDIRVDDAIRLEVPASGASIRSAPLVLDAGRLASGGELFLVDESGTVLAGYQPLVEGLALQTIAGERTPLVCP